MWGRTKHYQGEEIVIQGSVFCRAFATFNHLKSCWMFSLYKSVVVREVAERLISSLFKARVGSDQTAWLLSTDSKA